MRTKAIFPIISIILLIAGLITIVPVDSQAANATFGATLSYPGTVYSFEYFHLNVTETPGYSNYSATIYAGAQNVTNMKPITADQKVSEKNGSFEFSLIAPSYAPQTMYVYIQESADYNGVQVKHSQEIEIKVVSPIVFHAQLSDSLPVPIYNLTVLFYLDGQQVGSKYVPSLMPNDTVVVNLTLPSNLVSQGEHSLEITVSNASVFINSNKQSYTTTFYFGTPHNYDWIYYISIGAAIFMGFLFFVATRRKKGMGYIPKWKKAKKK